MTTEAAELAELGDPKASEWSDWRALRVRSGLSIRDLELRTGIHRITLSNIETGRIVARPWECARMLAALRPAHPAADAKAGVS